MCTDPTVLKAIAPAKPLLGIAIMEGLRAVITATWPAFFLSCFFFSKSQLHPTIPAATSTAAAYSAIPPPHYQRLSSCTP
eukprot:6112393-Pleurochrysis_carterae.AAC.2